MGTTLYPFNPNYMLSTCILSPIFGYIASLFHRISIVDMCHHSLRKLLSVVRFNVTLLCTRISRKKKAWNVWFAATQSLPSLFCNENQFSLRTFSALSWLFVTYANWLYYRTGFIWKDLLYMKRFVVFLSNFTFRIIFSHVSSLNHCLAIITIIY